MWLSSFTDLRLQNIQLPRHDDSFSRGQKPIRTIKVKLERGNLEVPVNTTKGEFHPEYHLWLAVFNPYVIDKIEEMVEDRPEPPVCILQ